MIKNSFRKDINGLRALAVVSVLIFHFDQDLLPGGFIGVDVFFVISGFLMTSIIFNGFDRNDFSLIYFYLNRARRIIPGLIFIILVSLFLGWFLFEPLTYQLMGRHAKDSLLFISNFTYLNESGYFDLDSYSKFFLHTWSLSVEWQFYLIYPIILIFLKKITSTNNIKKILVVMSLILFFMCIYVSYKKPSFAYFMFYARSWEMIIGGVAFLYPINKIERHAPKSELIGLILIIFSLFIINKNTIWPGYMALLPVMATYLCIISKNNNSILSVKLIQKIGTWSYSIYLIHWPLIVVSRKLDIGLSITIYLIIVLIASFIMYEMIEKKRNYSYGLLFTFIITLIISVYIQKDGVANRVDKKYQLTLQDFGKKYYGGFVFWDETQGKKHQFNKKNELPNGNFILSGDSYAMMYIKSFYDTSKPFTTITKTVCMFLPDYLTTYEKNVVEGCGQVVNLFLNELKEDATTPVILSQNWNAYNSDRIIEKKSGVFVSGKEYGDVIFNQIEKIISIGGSKRDYYIVGTYVHPDYDVYGCLVKHSMNNFIYNYFFKGKVCKDKTPIINSDIDDVFKSLENKYDNVHFIDPKESQCDEKGLCLEIYNGEIVFFDGDHLSIFGANIIGDYILSKIK